MNWRVLVGDVRERLRDIPASSVQTVVTSPPYWGLRDYGTPGQLGLESTPEEYVANMVEVFHEVRRVLRDDGTVWLNLGDSYARGGTGRVDGAGLKPKDLIGIPWRVAFALQADGWYLRSDIIWSKPNPMPESVTDRPTKAHEYVFLLSKSARYYFDADAVRESAVNPDWTITQKTRIQRVVATGGAITGGTGDVVSGNGARNIRSVWNIATDSFPGAHFAPSPKMLVEPCVKAGSAEGDTVLDPFCGSGTTGLVALRLGRSFVGIELNPAYAEMARHRIADDAPLFNVSAEVIETRSLGPIAGAFLSGTHAIRA